MKKICVLFMFFALLIGMIPAALQIHPVEAAVNGRPDIIFILTDDQDAATLANMPNVKTLLQDRGVIFNNTYSAIPLCCPSRSSILRGQYAHNTGVLANTGIYGGWQKFRPLETSTVATMLDNVGYRTAFYGKYMNGYGVGKVPKCSVPDGWDVWNATLDLSYRTYGSCEGTTYTKTDGKEQDYHTTAMATAGLQFIRDTRASVPVFVEFSLRAPHSGKGDPIYALRDRNYPAPGVARTPNFAEADMSDKPAFLQRSPLTSKEILEVDQLNKDRVKSLQAVDRFIPDLIQTLSATNRLNNTFIVFTTDNAYLMGQHNLLKKSQPYEEGVKFPLIVRGPGVVQGQSSNALISLADLQPTFAELAFTTPLSFSDGRSFKSLLYAPNGTWARTGLLMEQFSGVPWRSMHEGTNVYIEWSDPSASKEFYNLATDPYQLNNEYAALSAGEKTRLANRLDALAGCAAATCRTADSTSAPSASSPPDLVALGAVSGDDDECTFPGDSSRTIDCSVP